MGVPMQRKGKELYPNSSKFKAAGAQSLDAYSSLADVQQLTPLFSKRSESSEKGCYLGISVISPYHITAVANEDRNCFLRGTLMKQASVS